VHIAQLNVGAGGKIGNFGDQRTSTVGIDVGGVVIFIIGADLPDPGHGLKTLQQIRGLLAEAQAQQIATWNRSLQFGGSAEGDVAPVVDDGQALAKQISFFHIVRGEKNGFAALIVFANDFPEQEPGLRVEAGAGLIQKKYLRVVHHGAGDGKPLHHAAGESAHHLIATVTELESLE
jgi:hypothetical protein